MGTSTAQRPGGGTASGTVFKITSKGKLTVLHSFSSSDGANPFGGLVQAASGNLYGAAYVGGTLSYGVIYRISPNGQFSDLYNFDYLTGAYPEVTLLQHTTGTLYGDTFTGGLGAGSFYSLRAGLGAFVAPVPSSGKVGKAIGVLGQGFTGTTAVSFNGTAATFSVSSATFLTATVPDGATTGPLTVTTPTGTLSSKQNFRVTPVIQSFTPTSGPVGTPVTITGASFTQTSKVTCGGVAATTFTVDSDTQVTAEVPTGAKTGKIGITTLGGTAASTGIFTVSP